MRNGQIWLIAGGALSAAAAVLHLAIVGGGAAWYRFFHAGERLARMAEKGEARPAVTALAIAGVLAIWAWYAFAAAGLGPRPPLLRTGLVVIAAIYLLRAAAIVPLALFRPALADSFMVWSSAIVLLYGVCYAVGTAQAWPQLAPSTPARR